MVREPSVQESAACGRKTLRAALPGSPRHPGSLGGKGDCWVADGPKKPEFLGCGCPYVGGGRMTAV